jgi:hypothetical protein
LGTVCCGLEPAVLSFSEWLGRIQGITVLLAYLPVTILISYRYLDLFDDVVSTLRLHDYAKK